MRHARLSIFRSFGIAGPLPHPATQWQYPVGGRVGERAGAGSA